MRCEGIDSDVPGGCVGAETAHEADHAVFGGGVDGDGLAVVAGAGDS